MPDSSWDHPEKPRSTSLTDPFDHLLGPFLVDLHIALGSLDLGMAKHSLDMLPTELFTNDSAGSVA
jgi:hypothetical protein